MKKQYIEQTSRYVGKKTLHTLSPQTATLLAGIAFAVSGCCCSSTPRTPEESRKAYEKVKKERCNYEKKEAKIVRKIEELKIDLIEVRAKEESAAAKEQALLEQAKEKSSNYTIQDCPTRN